LWWQRLTDLFFSSPFSRAFWELLPLAIADMEEDAEWDIDVEESTRKGREGYPE